MANNFKKILTEICEEENIKLNFISNDWIAILDKDNTKKVIAGYKFDNNGHALGSLLDDKFALFDFLRLCNTKVVEHNLVYGPNNNEEYAKNSNSVEYVKQLFTKYGNDIVLKPNNGTCGNNVFHITQEEELIDTYLRLSKRYHSLSLCPFYDIINEYRVIMLNGRVKLIYKKIAPIVCGDGKSTIKELLTAFNYEYFKDYDNDNKNIVLASGEKFVYSWKFNLSGGAKPEFNIADDIKNRVITLAKETANNINLKFGSVDIINTIDGLYVLEVNSGVMMDNVIKESPNGYEIAKEIYREAIHKMFDNQM